MSRPWHRRGIRAVLLGTVGCHPPSKPSSPIESLPIPKEVVKAPELPEKIVAEEVQPRQAGDWVAEGPISECSDPPGLFVGPEPPPDIGEPDPRGWVSVERIVFRSGCVSPSELDRALSKLEPRLLDCVAAQTSESLTFVARVERWMDPPGLARLVVTTRIEQRYFEEPGAGAPVVDHERLSRCVHDVVGTLDLAGAASPLVFEVELQRGFPVMGGVPGG